MSKAPKADNLPFPPLPEKKYQLISLDIPWHHDQRGAITDEKNDRSPCRHYPTIDLDHALTMPVRDMADKDCLVALWITGPHMVQGFHNKLFDAWGVRPSSVGFCWVKLWNNTEMSQFGRTPLLEQDIAMGGGYTTRQNAEYVIFGRIGEPKRARADIRQVIISPRRDHSRKPEEYYRRMEHYMVAENRLDCFPGIDRPGWDSWGIPHREGEREDAVQRTGKRARCNTCDEIARVNDAGVCASCMAKAAL